MKSALLRLTESIQIFICPIRLCTAQKHFQGLQGCCLHTVFVRTHRSYVVNLHYVKSYSSDTVYLSNGEAAYLSKNYQKSFRTSYMNFLEKNYVRL